MYSISPVSCISISIDVRIFALPMVYLNDIFSGGRTGEALGRTGAQSDPDWAGPKWNGSFPQFSKFILPLLTYTILLLPLPDEAENLASLSRGWEKKKKKFSTIEIPNRSNSTLQDSFSYNFILRIKVRAYRVLEQFSRCRNDGKVLRRPCDTYLVSKLI